MTSSCTRAPALGTEQGTSEGDAAGAPGPVPAPASEMAVGLVLILLGSLLWRRLARSAPRVHDTTSRKLLARALLAALAAYLLASLLAGPFLPERGAPDVEKLKLGVLFQTLVLGSASLAGLLILRRQAAPPDAASLSRSWWPSLRLAVLTYGVFLLPLLGAYRMQSGFYRFLGWELHTQLAIETLRSESSLRESVWFLAAVILLQPTLEEVLYRRLLCAFLLKHLRPALALLVNSILFTVVHDQGWPQVFTLSLGLGWLYHRTGDLRAPCLMHVLHNGLTITWLFFAES